MWGLWGVYWTAQPTAFMAPLLCLLALWRARASHLPHHWVLQVLEGCPWVGPKPVYVLALEQPASETGLTYTLRTRVARQEMEDELSRVLGRRRADGSGLIHCSEMRDGVVTFEDDADAERFGQLLEADGLGEVGPWPALPRGWGWGDSTWGARGGTAGQPCLPGTCTAVEVGNKLCRQG